MAHSLYKETSDKFYDSKKYGFYGRQGGISKAGCKSLNAAYSAQDERENVAHNRALIAADLGLPPKKLAILKQIHSTRCHVITADTYLPLADDLEGDALVTDCPDIGVGVLTADCAPVLFYGLKSDGSPVIGAAHAGWDGALKGILGATIEKIRHIGAIKETIKAAIGPCIALNSYEVDMDFLGPFFNDNPANAAFFKPHREHDDKAYFDLKGYCASRLEESEISKDNILICPTDTCANKELFFSHRRATHEGGAKKEGRQLSLICI